MYSAARRYRTKPADEKLFESTILTGNHDRVKIGRSLPRPEFRQCFRQGRVKNLSGLERVMIVKILAKSKLALLSKNLAASEPV
jgi:hypothetical protein